MARPKFECLSSLEAHLRINNEESGWCNCCRWSPLLLPQCYAHCTVTNIDSGCGCGLDHWLAACDVSTDSFSVMCARQNKQLQSASCSSWSAVEITGCPKNAVCDDLIRGYVGKNSIFLLKRANEYPWKSCDVAKALMWISVSRFLVKERRHRQWFALRDDMNNNQSYSRPAGGGSRLSPFFQRRIVQSVFCYVSIMTYQEP